MSKRGIVTRGQFYGPSGAWARRRYKNAKTPNRGGFLVRNFIDIGEYSVPPQKGAAYETASAQIFASWFWPGAMSLSVGAYSVAGEQEKLLKTSIENAQSGSYALTIESETLKKGSKITSQAGTYSLTGENVTELKTSVVKPQSGSYALSGQIRLLKTSQNIFQTGFYNLTGEQLSLAKGSKVSAQTGFYSQTGENAALKRAALILAQMTPFALTGESLTFTIPAGAFSISLGTGTYALTDESLALLKLSRQGAQVGLYSLTDEPLTLVKGSRLSPALGAYSLTGNALSPKAARVISLQAGGYAESFANQGLVVTNPNAPVFKLVAAINLIGLDDLTKLKAEA